MKKFGLITLALSLYSSAFSQSNFVKGYLISPNGDTLSGEVKLNPKKEFDSYNKVLFKDAAGGQKNYKPDKVNGYGCGGKHFISGKYQDDVSFYKVHASGKILLLEIMIETMVMNEISYKSEYYITKPGDKEYTKLKENKTKKQLKEWMKDNSELLDKFDDDKFAIEKVSEVVKKYNDWAKSKG